MIKKVALYGALLALIALALKLVEYRLLVIDNAIEVYAGIIAVIFIAIGIAVGNKLTRPKEKLVEVQIPVPVQNKAADMDPGELGLSKREYEILLLMARGLSNQEIASEMYLSIHTIKTHVSNIFTKLDVKRRTQAIVKARELGLAV
ncbi:MAG: hypothetical protein BGO69_09905 [Bacteroidetes bacterium 46-16]|nr:MAG: hypothetical protein BGO69_09905 [Bacteroidetes bacterium 46-16]